jgi:hypothetical protein
MSWRVIMTHIHMVYSSGGPAANDTYPTCFGPLSSAQKITFLTTIGVQLLFEI